MTPPATAATRSAQRSAQGSRRSTVRHPRRISGPVAGAGSARAAAAVAIPVPGIALPGRRPSAPTRRHAGRKPAKAAQTRGVVLRTVDAFEGVSQNAVLDRIVRGRLWIGLLAFALVGIVAMQLFVLKLNTGIGSTLTREALLERDNAQLNVENSMSSGENRIAPLAAAAGMTLAPAGTVHFLAAGPAYVAHAATALSSAVQVPASTSASSSEASSESSGQTGAEASTEAGSESSAAAAAGGGSAAAGESEASPGESSSGESAGSSEATSESAASSTPESSSSSQPSESAASSTAVSGPGGGTEAGTQE